MARKEYTNCQYLSSKRSTNCEQQQEVEEPPLLKDQVQPTNQQDRDMLQI